MQSIGKLLKFCKFGRQNVSSQKLVKFGGSSYTGSAIKWFIKLWIIIKFVFNFFCFRGLMSQEVDSFLLAFPIICPKLSFFSCFVHVIL